MTIRARDVDADEAEGIAGCGPAITHLRAMHAGCPPVSMLSAARAGALPDDQQRDVDAHLDACHACRTAADDLALIVSGAEWSEASDHALLQRIRRATASPRQGLSWAWWPALGAVTLSLLLLVWRWPHSRTEPAPTPTTANRPPVRGVPPTTRPFVLAFSTPPVKLTLGAMTWRSGGQANTRYLEALRPGLDAYRAQDFAEAASRLALVAQRFPGAIEPRFYAGVSYLCVHESALAARLLREADAIDDPVFAEDVEWYLSVALQHAGDHAEARTRLRAACQGSGAHAREACDALYAWDAASPGTLR